MVTLNPLSLGWEGWVWPQHPRGIAYPLLTLSHRERQQGSTVVVVVVVVGDGELSLTNLPIPEG